MEYANMGYSEFLKTADLDIMTSDR
jgi:hypothetical protein